MSTVHSPAKRKHTTTEISESIFKGLECRLQVRRAAQAAESVFNNDVRGKVEFWSIQHLLIEKGTVNRSS